jgi:hypothetical protein
MHVADRFVNLLLTPTAAYSRTPYVAHISEGITLAWT